MRLKRIPLVPVWPGLIVANGFCSVAGFVAACFDSGLAGVTELGHRCVQYRTSKGWWAYTLLVCFAIANVATLAYRLVRGAVGPLKLSALADQWCFHLRCFLDSSSARSGRKLDGVVTCCHTY